MKRERLNAAPIGTCQRGRARWVRPQTRAYTAAIPAPRRFGSASDLTSFPVKIFVWFEEMVACRIEHPLRSIYMSAFMEHEWGKLRGLS